MSTPNTPSGAGGRDGAASAEAGGAPSERLFAGSAPRASPTPSAHIVAATVKNFAEIVGTRRASFSCAELIGLSLVSSPTPPRDPCDQKKSRCSESARIARLLSEQRRCYMPFVGRPMPVTASARNRQQEMRHATKLDYTQINQQLVVSAHSLCRVRRSSKQAPCIKYQRLAGLTAAFVLICSLPRQQALRVRDARLICRAKIRQDAAAIIGARAPRWMHARSHLIDYHG